MAVCASCGATTSAVQCPRCGGTTSPYATPRPETERAPAQRPPASTTTRLPVVPQAEPPADAPATPSAPAPAAASSPAPAAPPARDPGEATTVLPPVTVRTTPPVAAGPRTTESTARRGGAHPAPARAAAARPTDRPTGPARRRGRGPLVAALLALTLLVLGGVGWFVLRRPSAAAPGPAAPAVTVVQLPKGSHPCAESDAPDAGLQVFAGNEATSCGFALNVRTALGGRQGSVAVEAFSPKTGERYTMTCQGTTPVECTGANGALVYLLDRTTKVTIPAS